MRVFCPTCSEAITIGDELAGQATNCPLCKSAFTAPTLFPVPPAAPPVPVPPPPPPAAPRESASAAPATIPFPTPTVPPGYTKSIGFTVLPDIVQWIAPIALVLAFITTFFPWNGLYPGDHAVYTQSPWGALLGRFSTDTVGDELLKMDVVEKDSKTPSLKDLVKSNWFMLPYLPGLLAVTVLAIAFTILPGLKLKLPPQIEKLLPWRMGLLAALVLLLTLVLCVQSVVGFGLQNAVVARIEENEKDKRDKARTPDQIKTYEINHGKNLMALNIRQTTANRLAILMHILAVAGAAATLVLSRRVNKPPPRIELQW